MLGEWRWKHIAQQIFPVHIGQLFFTVTENKFNVWNYRFSGPNSIYLFKFSNINSKRKHEIFLKLTMKVPDVILVSLLLALNIFHMLFYYVFRWL